MKNILLILLIFFTYVSFAQKKQLTTAQTLFVAAKSDAHFKLLDSIDSHNLPCEELHKLLLRESLRELVYYERIIDEFPNSELVYDALFNKALINYAYLDNKNLATETFLKVLNFKTEKTELKYDALRFLSSIEIMNENFKQAIIYLDEMPKYKYYDLSADALALEKKIINDNYNECYKGLSQTK